jgi:hypothetical protein
LIEAAIENENVILHRRSDASPQAILLMTWAPQPEQQVAAE